MINYQNLQKYDSQGMYKIYDKWPDIAKEAYESNIEQIDFPKTTNFVFVGMGGSGSISDIFSALLSKTDAHVTIVKGYNLPKTVSSQPAVVEIS